MSEYVKIAEDENELPVEVPCEDDGTLLVSNVAAQFPGAVGLRYRPPDAQSFRGVRLVDGVLHPPENGWASYTFYVNFPKDPCVLGLENKRKMEEVDMASASKMLRSEPRVSDLVVLGLPWTTTEDELKDYFSAFGSVVLSQIKTDPATGKSKGYGFVRFADHESQLKAMGMRHMIGGRWCDAKLPQSKMYPTDPDRNRIFVGRCPEDITPEDLRSFFGQFGDVTDVYIPKPFRSFGFVTFANEHVAQSLCGQDVIVKGASVHIASAEPKNQLKRSSRLNAAAQAAAAVTAQANMNALSALSTLGATGAGGGLNLTPAMVAAMTQALQTSGWGGSGSGRSGGGSGGNAYGGNTYGLGKNSWL
ncbi:TAR DNA-binding protein 43-like isoform X2 [Petromyzon marinus]|uniref:TAR DNA-binding protein 43-like isoform X2 n=2 Tax=Petromyzon marinus TaxID=7757 RepID=A0AAJ7X1H9_PETMA|nr:TAR DNA-binding protein 43-like isoform X2 [Petromyzon marinus]XP_061422083.1 TAR DNA-binding protein 43-like isoform X2 [Lethenteron reissneri]